MRIVIAWLCIAASFIGGMIEGYKIRQKEIEEAWEKIAERYEKGGEG